MTNNLVFITDHKMPNSQESWESWWAEYSMYIRKNLSPHKVKDIFIGDIVCICDNEKETPYTVVGVVESFQDIYRGIRVQPLFIRNVLTEIIPGTTWGYTEDNSMREMIKIQFRSKNTTKKKPRLYFI